MNIIVLGPQGSGKGTQAELIASKLDFVHMESGKLLRQKAQTDERIKKMLNEGVLVPDEETIEYIEEKLQTDGHDFDQIIFDGFPRSLRQYNLLKSWLASKGAKIDKVIYLDITDKESVRRLSARRTCNKCAAVYNLVTNPPKGEVCDKCGGELVQRDDDTPEIIQKRLEVFHTQTKPILSVAEKDGILVRINGERPIGVISTEIITLLKAL